MKQTTLDEFTTALATTGSYLTPAGRRPNRVRGGFFAKFRLIWSVARVFPLTAFKSAFGRLTLAKWLDLALGTIRVPESLGVSVAFTGWENRKAHEGPVIYVANHMSALETFALPPALGAFGPFRIIAKASLSHLPFLKKAALLVGLLPIGRKDPRADLVAMKKSVGEALAAGNSVLVFPQGTRMLVFARSHYSSIGAKLAEQNGVPLVPLAVDTRILPTNDAAKKGGLFHDFGTPDLARDIRVACGPVIPCGPSRGMHERSFDWIASQLESWGIPTER